MKTLLIVVGLVVLGACGSSDDSDASTSSTVETSASVETDEPSATDPVTEPTTEATAAPEATTPATTAPSEPDEVDGETGLLPISLPAITVLAGDPGVEGAARPTFEWEAVDGATEYLVAVHLDGQPDWGVTTTDTTATVGGADLHPDATGPRVTEDMVWYVVASDADGTPIAQSAAQPVVTTGG